MSPNIATNAIGTKSNQVIASAPRDGVMSISLFLYAAVRIELRNIGPKVIHLLFVLNAGKDHFGAWNYPLGVLDVFFESSLIPNNSRILVRVRILEVWSTPGMTAIQSIQFRTDLVLRAWADGVTRQAHVEHHLTLLGVLGPRSPSRNGDGCSRNNYGPWIHRSSQLGW